MNTNLEKIKRISKSMFSSFYCFRQTKHTSRVNAKRCFHELQLRKFNIFSLFLVCSIPYRSYNYSEKFVKTQHLFGPQKLEASVHIGYKSPFFSSFSRGSNQFFKNSYEFIYQNLLHLIFHVDYEYELRKN